MGLVVFISTRTGMRLETPTPTPVFQKCRKQCCQCFPTLHPKPLELS